MQAITTKYLPATDRRGSRIKATAERGSIMIPFPSDLNTEEAHSLAASELCAKFAIEDAARYGTAIDKNPWRRPLIAGCLKNGTYAHVFLPRSYLPKP